MVLAVPRTKVAKNEKGTDQAEEHHTVLAEHHTVPVEHHMVVADIVPARELRRTVVAGDKGYEKEHRRVVAEEGDSHVVVDFADLVVDSLEVDHSQDQVRHHSLAGEGDLVEEDTDPEGAADNPLNH